MSHCQLPSETIRYFIKYPREITVCFSEPFPGGEKSLLQLMSDGIVHNFYTMDQFCQLRSDLRDHRININMNGVDILVAPIVLLAAALSW